MPPLARLGSSLNESLHGSSLRGDSERATEPESLSQSLSNLSPLQSAARQGWKRFASFAVRSQKQKQERRDSLKELFMSSFSDDLDWDSDSDDSAEAPRDVAEAGLSALKTVAVSVHGICTFLEDYGVSQDSMEELKLMEQSLQYTKLLKLAEAYTECLLESQAKPNKKVLNLFVEAWASLQEYSQDRYQQILEASREHQLKQWQEQVARFEEEKEQETTANQINFRGSTSSLHGSAHRRKLQSELEEMQEEAASLRNQLAQALTFKLECQKQVILAQEWSRCLQRRLAVQ